MNISFFLTPKNQVFYLSDDCPVRQGINDMMNSGYTAVPVVNRKGHYLGTVAEGDFLRLLLHATPQQLDQMTVGQVKRRVQMRTVSIDARMEDLFGLVARQNFAPVADGRGIFIGIITRHDVIRYMMDAYQKSCANK